MSSSGEVLELSLEGTEGNRQVKREDKTFQEEEKSVHFSWQTRMEKSWTSHFWKEKQESEAGQITEGLLAKLRILAFSSRSNTAGCSVLSRGIM